MGAAAQAAMIVNSAMVEQVAVLIAKARSIAVADAAAPEEVTPEPVAMVSLSPSVAVARQDSVSQVAHTVEPVEPVDPVASVEQVVYMLAG